MIKRGFGPILMCVALAGCGVLERGFPVPPSIIVVVGHPAARSL